MCTRVETVLTTTNMTAVSVSTRKAHSTSKLPDWIQRSTETLIISSSPRATWKKTNQESAAVTSIRPLVTYSDALAPICVPRRPAIRKPIRGRKTIALTMVSIALSALHHVDVFDGDRAAVAVEDDENCKSDRGFGRRNG